MKPIPIIPGQRFHNWKIIWKAKSRFRATYVWVECDCGTIKTVNYQTVRNGISKSCGCRDRTILDQLDQEEFEFIASFSPDKEPQRKLDFLAAKRAGRTIDFDGHYSMHAGKEWMEA